MLSVYTHEDVLAVIELYKDLTWTTEIQNLLSEKAERIFNGHRIRKYGAYVEITNGFPPLLGKSVDEVFKYDLSRLNALQTVSRLHRFNSWDEVENYPTKQLDKTFEEAVDLLVVGDMDGLTQLLRADPKLVHQQSAYPHQATLLHYCANNGVETERQRVPQNLVEVVNVLIDAGADKQAKMKVYQSEYTPYELAATSTHVKAAGLEKALLKALK
ncbi:hypothetical protein [Marinoscillum sp.]|uniref:hypothetical protein n=1 Tax=Marinoscillum sp. TaxID=2024838 RepID=UPI003BACD241